MKLKYLTLFLVVFIFLVSACATQPATQPNQPVCNKPYILVGNDCCLDKDDNSICDKDEQQEPKTQKIEESPKPETKTETKGVEEEIPEYTIGDVQADVNKVLRGDIFKYAFLTKSDKSTEDFDFYTDNIRTATLLAKRGQIEYFKVLDKSGITAFDIKNKEGFISDQDDLIEFVKENLPLLTFYTKFRKEDVVEEAKDGGEIHRRIEEKQSSGTRLKFLNISSEENEIYNDVTKLDTLSNKVVEILQVSLEDYELWYDNSKGSPMKFDLVGIDYLQAYSIQCSPNLIITIYANNYEIKLDEPNIKNHVNNERVEMLREAQALIDMCEQRYDFTYIRER